MTRLVYGTKKATHFCEGTSNFIIFCLLENMEELIAKASYNLFIFDMGDKLYIQNEDYS